MLGILLNNEPSLLHYFWLTVQAVSCFQNSVSRMCLSGISYYIVVLVLIPNTNRFNTVYEQYYSVSTIQYWIFRIVRCNSG